MDERMSEREARLHTLELLCAFEERYPFVSIGDLVPVAFQAGRGRAWLYKFVNGLVQEGCLRQVPNTYPMRFEFAPAEPVTAHLHTSS
jgi:hypothetical protein